MKKIIVGIIAVGILLTVIFIGGRSSKFPKVAVKPVHGFSSGGAKVPKLSGKPTAKELYAALVKYYDSFRSCAESGNLTISGAKLDRFNGSSSFEYRFVAPDKELMIHTGRNKIVVVTNGVKIIRYHPKTNTYSVCFRINKNGPTTSYKQTVSRWVGLGSDMPIDSLRLLKDDVVNGVGVYVLEIRYSSTVVTVYVGKTDLLPRKIVNTYQEKENSQVVTQLLSAFRANVELPVELFSIKPPFGAKRENR